MARWRKLIPFLPSNNGGGCHGAGASLKNQGLRKVCILGNPNVGKSVIFNRLTGAYVTVSNYPGTTVNVSRGKARIAGEEVEVVDTPGMYSLLPITEEERVARSILLHEKPAVVLLAVDAKNLERMLPLALQVIEARLPTILVLNMMDEAETAGIEVNTDRLEQVLGVPVVATVATTGRGIEILRRRLAEYVSHQSCPLPV
ncbi:MAG: FeoB small GTPase domain-containing protein [Chloroflexota bacterium]